MYLLNRIIMTVFALCAPFGLMHGSEGSLFQVPDVRGVFHSIPRTAHFAETNQPVYEWLEQLQKNFQSGHLTIVKKRTAAGVEYVCGQAAPEDEPLVLGYHLVIPCAAGGLPVVDRSVFKHHAFNPLATPFSVPQHIMPYTSYFPCAVPMAPHLPPYGYAPASYFPHTVTPQEASAFHHSPSFRVPTPPPAQHMPVPSPAAFVQMLKNATPEEQETIRQLLGLRAPSPVALPSTSDTPAAGPSSPSPSLPSSPQEEDLAARLPEPVVQTTAPSHESVSSPAHVRAWNFPPQSSEGINQSNSSTNPSNPSPVQQVPAAKQTNSAVVTAKSSTPPAVATGSTVAATHAATSAPVAKGAIAQKKPSQKERKRRRQEAEQKALQEAAEKAAQEARKRAAQDEAKVRAQREEAEARAHREEQRKKQEEQERAQREAREKKHEKKKQKDDFFLAAAAVEAGAVSQEPQPAVVQAPRVVEPQNEAPACSSQHEQRRMAALAKARKRREQQERDETLRNSFRTGDYATAFALLNIQKTEEPALFLKRLSTGITQVNFALLNSTQKAQLDSLISFALDESSLSIDQKRPLYESLARQCFDEETNIKYLVKMGEAGDLQRGAEGYRRALQLIAGKQLENPDDAPRCSSTKCPHSKAREFIRRHHTNPALHGYADAHLIGLLNVFSECENTPLGDPSRFRRVFTAAQDSLTKEEFAKFQAHASAIISAKKHPFTVFLTPSTPVTLRLDMSDTRNVPFRIRGVDKESEDLLSQLHHEYLQARLAEAGYEAHSAALQRAVADNKPVEILEEMVVQFLERLNDIDDILALTTQLMEKPLSFLYVRAVLERSSCPPEYCKKLARQYRPFFTAAAQAFLSSTREIDAQKYRTYLHVLETRLHQFDPPLHTPALLDSLGTPFDTVFQPLSACGSLDEDSRATRLLRRTRVLGLIQKQIIPVAKRLQTVDEVQLFLIALEKCITDPAVRRLVKAQITETFPVLLQKKTPESPSLKDFFASFALNTDAVPFRGAFVQFANEVERYLDRFGGQADSATFSQVERLIAAFLREKAVCVEDLLAAVLIMKKCKNPALFLAAVMEYAQRKELEIQLSEKQFIRVVQELKAAVSLSLKDCPDFVAEQVRASLLPNIQLGEEGENPLITEEEYAFAMEREKVKKILHRNAHQKTSERLTEPVACVVKLFKKATHIEQVLETVRDAFRVPEIAYSYFMALLEYREGRFSHETLHPIPLKDLSEMATLYIPYLTNLSERIKEGNASFHFIIKLLIKRAEHLVDLYGDGVPDSNRFSDIIRSLAFSYNEALFEIHDRKAAEKALNLVKSIAERVLATEVADFVEAFRQHGEIFKDFAMQVLLLKCSAISEDMRAALRTELTSPIPPDQNLNHT